MTDDNNYRHRRHCVLALHAHLVFVTKYRRKVFTANVLNDMRGLFAAVCADFAAALVEIDGEDDHVHLLVNYPPKVPLSRLVNSLQRRIEPPPSPDASRFASALLQGCSMVAQLLRRLVFRCADQHHPPIHRITTYSYPRRRALRLSPA